MNLSDNADRRVNGSAIGWPTFGMINSGYTFTATISPVNTAQPITYL